MNTPLLSSIQTLLRNPHQSGTPQDQRHKKHEHAAKSAKRQQSAASRRRKAGTSVVVPVRVDHPGSCNGSTQQARPDNPGPKAIIPTFEILYRMPSSPDTLFTVDFLETLTQLKLERSWYAYIPAMLGYSTALDSAAKAVMYAHALDHSTNTTNHTPKARFRHCDANYLYAIESLRSNLTPSDSSLVTVGLLCLYEALMKQHARAYFCHAGGGSAILLAQRTQSKYRDPSPIARACLYTSTHGTFQQPCLEGRASPFEHPCWLDMEPVSPLESLGEETRRLRKLGNQVIIRLPGLLVRVRRLRETSARDMMDLARTMSVASELLLLKDDAAETALLRQVSVRPTVDTFDRSIFPYSFEYKCSAYDKETLLLYWSSRLMVIRLCLVLYDLRDDTHHRSPFGTASTCISSDSSTTFGSESPAQQADKHGVFQASTLEELSYRLIMNVLMTWQDGYDQMSPLGTVWGALMYKPPTAVFRTFQTKILSPVTTSKGSKVAVAEYVERAVTVQEVRKWVLAKHNEGLMGWSKEYTPADMDEEEELYAGGPLKGWASRVIAGKEDVEVG